MSDMQILWTIALGAVVTAIIRAGPVLFLAERNFPVILRDWLAFIPAGILSSIIITEAIHYPDKTSFGVSVSGLAVLTTFIAGFISHSLLVCVMVSIAAFLLFQRL